MKVITIFNKKYKWQYERFAKNMAVLIIAATVILLLAHLFAMFLKGGY